MRETVQLKQLTQSEVSPAVLHIADMIIHGEEPLTRIVNEQEIVLPMGHPLNTQDNLRPKVELEQEAGTEHVSRNSIKNS